MNYLKKRLDKKKGRWAEELPFVLWADRTTAKTATGQIPTARYLLQDPQTNNRILTEDLDTIDELRDLAKLRIAAHQQRIAKSYNKNIRIWRFQIGDLVLRKTFQNTKDPANGKLAPKWEGPYLIDSKARKGPYSLADMEGTLLPRSWNAVHLKAYFLWNKDPERRQGSSISGSSRYYSFLLLISIAFYDSQHHYWLKHRRGVSQANAQP